MDYYAVVTYENFLNSHTILNIGMIIMSLSEITYENAGVSVKEQNATNSEIIRRIRNLGMNAEGLFGGAVSLKDYKNHDKVFLDMKCSAVMGNNFDDLKELGYRTAESTFNRVSGIPVGALDYIASPVMKTTLADFVEGVALSSIGRKCTVLGGETAEMKDTYKKDCMDAFVHVLAINHEGIGLDITDIIRNMEDPLLVVSTDGTGTKTKFIRNPEDIIYHGSNDLAPLGVKILGFGLYVAGNVAIKDIKSLDKKASSIASRLNVKKFDTATYYKETYMKGEMDIAGTVFGIIDRKDLITGEQVTADDEIIGITVDGFMTNGYTLARRFTDELIKSGKVKSIDEKISELNNESIREALSKPHRYMTDILFGDKTEGILSRFKGKIHAMAHITGGGIPDNIIRTIPKQYNVIVYKHALKLPPIMQYFHDNGLNSEEIYNNLNAGIGYTLTVAYDAADEIADYIDMNYRYSIKGLDRQALMIGTIEQNPKNPRFRYE